MADDDKRDDSSDDVVHPTRSGRRTTINDVARIAEVSKKTVSRVINNSPLVRENTRERVQAVIDETGFTPDPQARALAFRRSFLVGMIYDNPSPQYVVNFQRGVLKTLAGTPFLMVVQPIQRSDPEMPKIITDFVLQQRPKGLILTPSISEDDDVAKMLRELDCPYVRVASAHLDAPDRMVRTNDYAGAKQAGEHLASLGHKRIGHVPGRIGFRSVEERMAGFREGLAEHGVSLPDDLIEHGDYTFDSGVAAAHALMDRPNPPTAIFLGNDEMAVGAYHALRERGMDIPRDVSIVGYDDTPIAARMWPQMSTVRVPIREIGARAAELLLEEHPEHATISEFSSELIVRASTRPL